MARSATNRLSGPIRILGLGVAAIVLVLFFIVLGFPYDRLAEYIAAEANRSSGLSLTIGELGPTLQLLGPGVHASGVTIEGGGSNYRADHATLRPAWSTSWLRGVPAVHAQIESPAGVAVGTYTMGIEFGWEGVLEGVDLEAPPIRQMFPNLYLTGLGDVDLDVKRGVEGPEGTVRFELTEGSVSFGDFPLLIPYATIEGSLVLGDEAYLTVEEFTFTGPMLTADVTGKVLPSSRFEEAPLELLVQIQAESDLQIPLASAGVRFDKEGSARVRISGTPLQPIIH